MGNEEGKIKSKQKRKVQCYSPLLPFESLRSISMPLFISVDCFQVSTNLPGMEKDLGFLTQNLQWPGQRSGRRGAEAESFPSSIAKRWDGAATWPLSRNGQDPHIWHSSNTHPSSVHTALSTDPAYSTNSADVANVASSGRTLSALLLHSPPQLLLSVLNLAAQMCQCLSLCTRIVSGRMNGFWRDAAARPVILRHGNGGSECDGWEKALSGSYRAGDGAVAAIAVEGRTHSVRTSNRFLDEVRTHCRLAWCLVRRRECCG